MAQNVGESAPIWGRPEGGVRIVFGKALAAVSDMKPAASILDTPLEGSPRYPGIPAAMDGSGAVVYVDSNICQAAVAYPITPSTPMGDGFAAEYANGKRNLWGEEIAFLEPESEHSSATACEGYALAGGRVSNFTSGQGLILMKEVLYVISGKRLPVVFHIGARAITSQALNIHCGHDDVMGVADCGWGMVFARNAQESADLALIARRAAEDTETPFFNVQDGFLGTHTLESLKLPEPELMRYFVGEPSQRVRNLFHPGEPLLSGPVVNQDAYMKGRVAQRFFYARVAGALKEAMREYGELTGRRYGMVRSYRMEDAEFAFVGLGTMMETAEVTVDYLRRRGMRVGAVSVTSFRPFPPEEIVEALAGCRAVAVIERTDNPLAQSNPLSAELKAAFKDAHEAGRVSELPEIQTGVAGLGGRDVLPGHFVAAAGNLMRRGRKNFVLGVHHPEELPVEQEPDVRSEGSFTMRGHSVGGFGSVTTNKVIATVAADLFGMHVQAFGRYGSEKKGLPTNYYLTLANEPVRLHAEPKQVNFVAIQDPSALESGAALEGVEPGGIAVLQTPLPADQVWPSLPARAQSRIAERSIRLYAFDALGIAQRHASRGDLQIRMQGIALLGAFLRLTPFAERKGIGVEEMFGGLGQALEKYFGKRGKQVVEENLAVAREGFEKVTLVPPGPVPKETPPEPARREFPVCDGTCDAARVVSSAFAQEVIGAYARGHEPDLPADMLIARSLMPAGTASFRSFRTLAPTIPVFEPEKCVGCMECVTECPDTAILARVVEKDGAPPYSGFVKTTKYYDLFEKKGQTGGLFGIFIDPDKCKGCGECVTACGTHDALRMAPKAEVDLAEYDAGMDLYRALPDTPKKFINEKALADMMLADRSLLYTGGAGSCMGCGEGTAIRLMLAATGFVYGEEGVGIVAATGCNSVFGSTYPFNPYRVPWTNSLFENAPADAMGIRLRWDQAGHKERRLWVIGGDGALFDIGFQSLSRMLMSGMDIKVLVLDTQVYSNTGGQSSTATYAGQSAKMAQFGKAHPGKTERRKELAQIAMMHPGVFVAQTTAAHINHFYKAVMAANAYPGPAVVIAYTPCMPEHGIADDRANLQARLAVESRTFPLLIFDPAKGEKLRDCLSLQGNPDMKSDWHLDPKGNPVDFVAFARTEGRFGRHFDGEGNPGEALLAAQAERLENWHRLQELAGIR